MGDVRRSSSGLAYRRGGGGTPVVLLHGIPGAGRVWEPVVERLPEGLDVVVPDLVGFGESRPPRRLSVDDLGPAAQSYAVEALLDEIGVERAVVAGHDLGGPVAVLLADRRPDLVSGLLFLAGNAFPDTPVPFPLSLATRPVVGRAVARLLFARPALRLMLRRGVGEGGQPPDEATYLGSRGQAAAISVIFAGALQRLRELYTPVERALRSLSAPLVVGWGDRDPFFPVAQATRTADAGGGRLRVYPGAGHFLPHERPDAVAEEIAELCLAALR